MTGATPRRCNLNITDQYNSTVTYAAMAFY